MIKHLFVSVTLAATLIGSAGAGAPVPPRTSTLTGANTSDIKCMAPRVRTQIKDRAGKMVWVCRKPGVAPDTVIAGQVDRR